jgi:ABC-2 type transport system permease protein
MMNFRGGMALIKGSLLEFMTSKGFFWTLAFGWMAGPLIYLFVWSMAVGQGSIAGYDRNDFIFYYLCMILVNQFTYPSAHWSTGEAIQNGAMSSILLRPMPIFYGAVACDMSVKVVCMPFVTAFTIILGFGLRLKVSLSPASLFTFTITLLLALILRFMLSYILALLAFWTQRISSLLAVNDTFVFLLAGQVAPISLLPDMLKQTALFLPYRYMLSFPIEVIMGKLNGRELGNGIAIQILWVITLFVIHHFVNKAGVRRYTAIGG